MGKSEKENRNQQTLEEESIEYIKEIYDDLMKTYQALFEHIDKVDQLIKNKNSKKED